MISRQETHLKFFDGLFQVMASYRFPLFMLYCLLFYSSLMLGVLLIPANAPAAQFAQAFKMWCFGYDPATHRYELAYLVMMLVNPLVLAFLIIVVWYGPLRPTWQKGALQVRYGLTALIFCLAVAGALFGLEIRNQTGELPFPVESLRTTYTPPKIHLINQENQAIQLQDFKGKVVLITAVYATCGSTCPMILAQTKQAIAQLDPTQTADLVVWAITLDPERDDLAMRKAMAQAQGVEAPQFHFLGGDPEGVNHVLDQLNFGRKRDPKTGIITHANLFLLIDRNGKLAFQFSLGPQQEAWLEKAIQSLLKETPNG